tara:strand:- start:1174 stop:1392 length:219 start_codon:yes stop_codon:yes gene_type:complete
MAKKYSGKNDIEAGVEFIVNNDVVTSYGTLKTGTKVILQEVTHFPTSYKVKDDSGKIWLLRTYEVEKIESES